MSYVINDIPIKKNEWGRRAIKNTRITYTPLQKMTLNEVENILEHINKVQSENKKFGTIQISMRTSEHDVFSTEEIRVGRPIRLRERQLEYYENDGETEQSDYLFTHPDEPLVTEFYIHIIEEKRRIIL